MRNAYGILVWFVATLFVIYAFCLNTAAAVFSDSIKMSLQLNTLGVSFAIGAFTVGFALMQMPAGYLLDRYNIRYVTSFGVFLLALGNLLISYSDNLLLFALSNFIQGLGGSFAFIAAGVLISKWFPTHLFPIFFGLTQTLSCILSGILHYLFRTALDSYSWNYLYRELAVFGFILLLLTLLVVSSPKDEPVSVRISFSNALRLVCSNTQMWLCSIAAATSFGVLLAYAGFWYMNVEKYYSVSTYNALILSAVTFVGIGIGTPLLGLISNGCQSRTLVIHVSLALGNMALLLGLYLPHFDSGNLFFAYVVSFCIGFFLAGSMLFYTLVSESSSDNTRGVAFSLINTWVFLSNTLLMFIPYLFITTASKQFFTYLWVLPFSVMIALLLLYFIKDTYSED